MIKIPAVATGLSKYAALAIHYESNALNPKAVVYHTYGVINKWYLPNPSTARSLSTFFTGVSKAAGYVGIAITAYQVINGQISFQQGVIDLGMVALGMFGGSTGIAISATYFIGKAGLEWYNDTTYDIMNYF